MYSQKNIPLFIEDHTKTLEALKARDAKQAEKALLSHLRNVMEVIKKERKTGG